MSLNKQIRFLEQCENNMSKLNFYLDMSNSSISCGPCLVLKRYHNWSLKNIYNVDIDNKNNKEYFLKVIEKLDYKVIGNMEYKDLKSLVIAYFSLGEIYFLENNIELSKSYFTKVIDIMEEFLKGGNRFQTEELGQKNGVVFFELLMWARKNLGDMVEVEEALALYESMIGEEEILYLQKHYSTYRVSKVLNLPDKANDAARSIIKICPSYKNINIDVVEYLTTSKNYYNALDIAIGEYNKNNITHWINAINNICVTAEELSIDCVDEVIEFSEILMGDLKVVEWSNIILSLYKNVRSVELSVIRLLDYLKKSFNKINYKQNDFINCSQAITVLNEIYEDIRICKYNKVYLREYEFDFTFYLMNTAIQNESYEKGLEAATKLASIIEVYNNNKDIHSYVIECEEICRNNVKGDNYKLDEYPWAVLYKNIEEVCGRYGIKSGISLSDMARNNSKKIMVGINAIQNKFVEETLNAIIGESIFREDKDIVFISNEELCVNEDIKKNYTYDVVVKRNIFKDLSRCIVTYEKSINANIADKNIIVIDGHKELRDIDITYLKHILEVSRDTEVILLINRADGKYTKENVNYNKMLIENLLVYKEEIKVIDLQDFSEPKTLLEAIMGDDMKAVIPLKFKNFTNGVNTTLDAITEDIKFTNGVYKERRHTLKECLDEYTNIEDEIKANYNEFISKIQGDIDFLGKYADAKIASVIPDLIEKNLDSIDDLEDIATLKVQAEKIFGEAIVKWCNKNIYGLMLEQFEVYIAKYSKLYGYHKESIEKISENRNDVASVYPEFRSKIKLIPSKPLEEVIKGFLDYYDEFLNSINYEVTVIPNEKFLSTVTEGIKVMFMKSEEKAENSRVKIKNQVIENKENISAILSGNINQHLQGISDKLQGDVKEIFEGAIAELAVDKSVVNDTIKSIDDEHNKKMIENEEIEIIMNFIKVEVLKYSKQVECNVVYSKNRCHRLI